MIHFPTIRQGRVVALCMLMFLPFFVSAQAVYSWEEDLHHRLLLDFGKTHEEVKAYIRRYLPNVTEADMQRWESSKALETMVIDGRKRYFNHAGSNLFLIDKECAEVKRKKEGASTSGQEAVNMYNIPAIIREAGEDHLAQPKRMRVTYTLTVHPDAVPEGQTIRCWLPFPRRDMKRQQNVKLLTTSEKHYRLAPEHAFHSSLYMEKQAEKGKPTVFSESFEFTAHGFWGNIQPEKIKPYDKSSKLYREYTSEREKHIRFTPRLRHIADSLTRGETNALLKARRLFRWVNDNFPWASAREYSTIPCIPEYVLDNRHGDCGQVTLLFLTLCRICGIPGHFQSGFMMHPGNQNLHDWGEIYFEGVGWVPVDMSFGIPSFAHNEDETFFFLGGIDSWRLVVNQDFGKDLFPQKKYPRSETVDFQRGEVEWQGGNLYFDQWNWDMHIDYSDP